MNINAPWKAKIVEVLDEHEAIRLSSFDMKWRVTLSRIGISVPEGMELCTEYLTVDGISFFHDQSHLWLCWECRACSAITKDVVCFIGGWADKLYEEKFTMSKLAAALAVEERLCFHCHKTRPVRYENIRWGADDAPLSFTTTGYKAHEGAQTKRIQNGVSDSTFGTNEAGEPTRKLVGQAGYTSKLDAALSTVGLNNKFRRFLRS